MLDWLPPGRSTFSVDLDGLFYLIYVVVGIWFVAAEILLVYFAVRYRRRQGKPARYLTGETWRQAAWVVVPAAVVLVFDLWIDAAGAKTWEKVTGKPPAGAMRVLGTAKQFNWEFRYAGPDGAFSTGDDLVVANELHVPVDQPVQVWLTSKDVIHSFFLPYMRLKMDVMPGRETRVWFEPTQAGVSELACAELCGFGHYTMHGRLVVHEPAEYEAWLHDQSAPNDEVTE